MFRSITIYVTDKMVPMHTANIQVDLIKNEIPFHAPHEDVTIPLLRGNKYTLDVYDANKELLHRKGDILREPKVSNCEELLEFYKSSYLTSRAVFKSNICPNFKMHPITSLSVTDREVYRPFCQIPTNSRQKMFDLEFLKVKQYKREILSGRLMRDFVMLESREDKNLKLVFPKTYLDN